MKLFVRDINDGEGHALHERMWPSTGTTDITTISEASSHFAGMNYVIKY